MNKKWIAGMLALVFLLSGCQLAVPGAEAEASETADTLAGVFITTEYIELADDTLPQNGTEAIFSGSAPAHIGKLYAAKTDKGFAFDGLEGMILASFSMIPEGYQVSQADPGLSEVHTDYYSGDARQSVQQTATVYVPQAPGEVIFYFNPIYQTSSGDVYLLPGTGMSMNTDLSGEMTQELSETVCRDSGEYTGTVEVTVACIQLPASVTLIQMDADHRELKRESYTPSQLPESLTPHRSTAYILIEEDYADGIRRSVNQPTDGAIQIFFTGENGLCIQSSTEVLWAQ